MQRPKQSLFQRLPRPRRRREARGGPRYWRWFFLLLLVSGAVWYWQVRKPSPGSSESLEVTSKPQPVVPVSENSEPTVRLRHVDSAQTTTAAPEMETDFRPRIPRDVFEAQIAMSRDGICSGSIDGAWGQQTQNAVIAYQQKHGLRVTAQLDNATRERLQLQEPPLMTYTIQAGDFARLRPLPKGWLARSEIDRLDYSTILELVAEKHAANPNKIRQLNPHVVNWDAVNAGTVVAVPNVTRPALPRPVALIVIHLTNKTLQAFDSDSRLLLHFPCSIARRVEKRPVGRLEVQVTAENPNYTFNPDTFPDSEEAQRLGRKLILQPGPNNPVGLAWIDLNLDGYGIHGSPDPEMVGRTESSGCFRLANWNATYLLRYAFPGLPVQVEP